MALFPNAREEALAAGVAVLREVEFMNQGREKPTKIGIELNTGWLMLATVVSQARLDGTVLSDAVNLSSPSPASTRPGSSHSKRRGCPPAGTGWRPWSTSEERLERPSVPCHDPGSNRIPAGGEGIILNPVGAGYGPGRPYSEGNVPTPPEGHCMSEELRRLEERLNSKLELQFELYNQGMTLLRDNLSSRFEEQEQRIQLALAAQRNILEESLTQQQDLFMRTTGEFKTILQESFTWLASLEERLSVVEKRLAG